MSNTVSGIRRMFSKLNFITCDRTRQRRIKASDIKYNVLNIYKSFLVSTGRPTIQQLIKYVERHFVIYCRFIEH